MTRNKLTKDQRGELLKWVAEGLETDEINKRAGELDPPFRVSRAQVDYYRKSRAIKLKAIASEADYDALKSGLALKEERVRRLAALAELLEDDLFNGVTWTQDVKMIGTGDFQERVEFETFNASEIQQYRGLLDDIAKETGGRAQRQEVTGAEGERLKFDIESWKRDRSKRVQDAESDGE
jgi:hypothetical protein